MAAQIVSGWALAADNIRRWSRTVKSNGAITDESIADAGNTAAQVVQGIILESGQPWSIRSKTIDDVGTSLGVYAEYRTRRLFIEQDLGITDLTKVMKLWRVSADASEISHPIYHCQETGPENIDRGTWLARYGDERWREDGDFNTAGNYDMSVLLYNWGESLAGGKLKITYWFTPAQITKDVFSAVDANGDRTSRPPFPKQFWIPLQEYMKLVLLETMGDQYKTSALWARWGGTSGLEKHLRTLAGSFQLGESNTVKDSFIDEVQ
jgi:hypothetical protein